METSEVLPKNACYLVLVHFLNSIVDCDFARGRYSNAPQGVLVKLAYSSRSLRMEVARSEDKPSKFLCPGMLRQKNRYFIQFLISV